MFLEAKENSNTHSTKRHTQERILFFFTLLLATFKSIYPSSSFPHLVRTDQRSDSLKEICIISNFPHKHTRKIVDKSHGKQVTVFGI